MRVQLIRHATVRIDMNGRRFLVDPMLSPVGAMPPVQNAANESPIPMIPLPFAVDEVLEGIQALLITHLHRDHLDDAAIAVLPKDLPLFCQPFDVERLKQLGFCDVRPVQDVVEFDGIEIVRTEGKHGIGLIGKKMGQVSGFVLRSVGEPPLYLAGDTIWCGYVQEVLDTFQPDVIIVNAGSAQFLTGTPITMTSSDVARVCHARPAATVVAVHMDTINHCGTTRRQLRAELSRQGLLQLKVPADGESIDFPG